MFNGEVYGHERLRLASPDWDFQSRSDTETLLARALDDPHRALQDANAMLAMALYDERRISLVIARDRLGKKPLFVYRGHDVLAFASELKAFAALGLPLTLDDRAVAEYRWLSYVPSPRSIWQECSKFPPASWARLDLRSPELPAVAPTLFWDPLAGYTKPFGGTYTDALDELDVLLADAVKIRLEADVPVGLFLSGGIDSSLVAAYVARTNRSDVQAFVVATGDSAFDESSRAKLTARRLGLPVQTIQVPWGASSRTLESLAWHYDEPHAALSQLGIMEMSEVAKRFATVVLTGDGGDEVFLGYPWIRYPAMLSYPRRVFGVVPGGRRALERAQREPLIGWLARAAAIAGLNPTSTIRKLRIIREAVDVEHDVDAYELFQATRLRSELAPSDREQVGSQSLLSRVRDASPKYAWEALLSRGPAETAGALDLLTYLRDDVLQKVDRGTMAHGLEARSPLLDYRIVEFGQSLPTEFKVAGGTHKRVLRELAARLVDAELGRLPKRGFSVASPLGPSAPLTAWNDYVERAWLARWAPS